MLSIFANAMRTATRIDHRDETFHWMKAVNARQARQIDAQRKLAQMRDVGRW